MKVSGQFFLDDEADFHKPEDLRMAATPAGLSIVLPSLFFRHERLAAVEKQWD